METYEFKVNLGYYQIKEVSDSILDFSKEYRRSLLSCLRKAGVPYSFLKNPKNFIVLYRPSTHVRGWCCMSVTGIIENFNVFDSQGKRIDIIEEMIKKCANEAFSRGMSNIRIRCEALDYDVHEAIESFLEKAGCIVKFSKK